MLAKSLLKWAGGKSWLVRDYSHLLPDPATIKHYREPFAGSAAVARHYLGRCQVTISDRNQRLIKMYRGVREDPDDVIRLLRGLKYDRATYEVVRSDFNTRTQPMLSEVAAWFIYLNR